MPHFGIKKCAKMGQPDKSYVNCASDSTTDLAWMPHFLGFEKIYIFRILEAFMFILQKFNSLVRSNLNAL